MSCHICGERLHMGCCNPGRPAIERLERMEDAVVQCILQEESGTVRNLCAEIYDLEPFALTDSHVDSLERAIRAEGYEILTDPETGHIRLGRL
jgi:hypothetical protein